MQGKKFTVYPSLDLQKPQIPKRLLLYPLEPIGIGTFYCESLTSYLNRLAAKHCVSLRAFVIAIFQMFEKQKICLFPCNFSLKTLNGLTSNAQKTIQVIESLTSLAFKSC